MTANEILSKTFFTNGFANYELEIIHEAMKEYAREKCLQQRVNCSLAAIENFYLDDEQLKIIGSAPEPTFD